MRNGHDRAIVVLSGSGWRESAATGPPVKETSDARRPKSAPAAAGPGVADPGRPAEYRPGAVVPDGPRRAGDRRADGRRPGLRTPRARGTRWGGRAARHDGRPDRSLPDEG